MAGLLVWLCLTPIPAKAHRGSDSQVNLLVQNRQVIGNWEIGLHDLAPLAREAAPKELEAARDWLKVRPGLAEQVLERLRLAADNRPCELDVIRREVVERPAGLTLQLALQGMCPQAPLQLTVDYRLLFDTDPRHQGVLRLETGDLVRPAVFTAESPIQHFVLRAPKVWERATSDLMSGIWHIWTGWDHLLFILCLLAPAVLSRRNSLTNVAISEKTFGPVLRDVLAVVTAFTVAHSLTLSAASLNWLSLPTRFTESTIAASVVIAAALNLFPMLHVRRWQAAFGFGLIHGFGFASAVNDMGVTEGALLPTLLAFNLGVELGQLAVVTALLPLAYTVRDRVWYRPIVVRLGSAMVAGIALMWLIERAFDVSFMPVS